MAIVILNCLALAFSIFPFRTIIRTPINVRTVSRAKITTYFVWAWVSVRILGMIVPIILVTVFTVLSVVMLKRAQTKPQTQLQGQSGNSQEAKENQLNSMSVVVATTFALIKTPYLITYFVLTYEPQREGFHNE